MLYVSFTRKVIKLKKDTKLRKKWLKTIYHKVLSSIIHKLLHPFLAVIKRSIGLGSGPKTVASKRKLLLIKYIYKKMNVIEKEFYHPVHLQNKWNEATDVRGNGTVNLLVMVLCTRVWSSYETIRHHILNIFCSPGLWDVRRSEILLNHHRRQTSIF